MTDRPNILLVTADHWPGALLGEAGHKVVRTPTLDQLARNGVRFSRAYSECPVCIPARRTLLTGTTPRTHGDRTFQVFLPMPNLPTIADVFRDNGYQAYAVGKLHVYPPRARVGFDDVILVEEGRPQLGGLDDYEIFLGDQGYAGQQFLHGMSNNDYVNRAWHLPEELHATNWITRQMARTIKRRDPTRPAFWYLSYTHPHPPLVPAKEYYDFYRSVVPDEPFFGTWPRHPEQMPCRMNNRLIDSDHYTPEMIRDARRAFYAQCTQIDHQLRIIIGTLREERLLANTILMFLADHGDMLGNHGLWAKRLFYEWSANIPMILVGIEGCPRVGCRRVDHRLVALQDVMPTLLDLAGIDVPPSVDGLSMVGETKRPFLYGEYGEAEEATRMIHDGRYKLIYYAAGNRLQLFDLENDPCELQDLIDSADHRHVRERLTAQLVAEFYGSDLDWLRDGQLVGLPAPVGPAPPNRDLALQRGSHWPPPPPLTS
ncbi:MAG: arylsulfatase [Gemmatales bacterium]|nr:MAG: arylsulfatase [Gemmatales bacterium]